MTDSDPSVTILLLDDDPFVAKSTSRLLARAGYQVLLAHTPSEAAKIARSHPGPIHLLLSDVVLPEKSGPEAADEIARLRPGMGVLFFSGYLEEDLIDHEEAVFRGEFLSKPYEPAELLARVAEVLGRA